MASKYQPKFPIPEEFPDLLMNFTREILRDQPADIYEYGHLYWKAMHEVSICFILLSYICYFTHFYCVTYWFDFFNFRKLNLIIMLKVQEVLSHLIKIESQILQHTLRLNQVNMLIKFRTHLKDLIKITTWRKKTTKELVWKWNMLTQLLNNNKNKKRCNKNINKCNTCNKWNTKNKY